MYDEIEMSEVPARVDSQAGEVASSVSEVPQPELEQREKDPRRFYVYSYLREDGTPYYIGKGTGRRAYATCHGIKRPVDLSRIQLIQDKMTEAESFDLERKLISHYGRKNTGTGILRNLTDGGEGVSGRVVSQEIKDRLSVLYRGRKMSDECIAKIKAAKANISESTRKKISQARKNSAGTYSPEFKAKMASIVLARGPEAVAKFSQAFKGRSHSDETKAKISKSSKSGTPEVKAKIAINRKPMSAESKAKLVAYWTGRKHTEESRRKMSASRIGKVLSSETKNKLSLASKGRRHTEETRKRMSEIQKGIYSNSEKRAAISARQMGDKNHRFGKKVGSPSEETRLKLSLALSGQRRTDEQKARIRAGILAAKLRKREKEDKVEIIEFN